MTPTAMTKATRDLLELACAAAERFGAVGVLVIAEGPMDWEAMKGLAGGVTLYVAIESELAVEEVREAGLVPVEVEPTEAAIIERITLALIEAVATDLLRAGARVVVVYSGFEADELDSMTVVRLGEHLERLTRRATFGPWRPRSRSRRSRPWSTLPWRSVAKAAKGRRSAP